MPSRESSQSLWRSWRRSTEWSNGRRPGLHIVKTFELLLEDVNGELDTLKVSGTLILGCLLPEQECLGDAHCGREVDVGRRVGRIPEDEQVFIDPGVWLRLPR